jgi:exonuclease VII small subunit
MSFEFETAINSFQRAKNNLDDDAMRQLADGLIELARALQKRLEDIEDYIRSG